MELTYVNIFELSKCPTLLTNFFKKSFSLALFVKYLLKWTAFISFITTYLGYAYIGLEDWQKARDYVIRALKVVPNSDKAKFCLANVYFKQKSYKEALNVIKTRLNPYSRDFFELAVEVMDNAMKAGKLCSECRFYLEESYKFCPDCGIQLHE